MTSFLTRHEKSHSCGQLRKADAESQVVLTGWVDVRRDHGGCVFVDLRDSGGITQIVFDPQVDADAHAKAGDLRNEFCIGVVGKVVSRGANINPNLPTGEIEVMVSELEIFSRSATPPFPIENEIDTNEALRLKHRYLDLRRPVLMNNLKVRSAIMLTSRRYLGETGFTEVETPFMVKYTPGGARNFLVPSRLNPGSFYALAESPQIFKQLLMVSGFERYFQITRCFRDEDLRYDRQPEFSQIDIEMSFVTEQMLQREMEGLMKTLWREVLGVELSTPFRRMAWAEAMAKYGVDKPDLRLDLVLCDVTEPARQSGFRIFENAVGAGGIVKCLRVPGGDKLTRSQLDSLTDFAKPYGVKGVAFARVEEGGTWKAPFAKAMTDESRTTINQIAGAETGDVLLFVADKAKVANTCMGAIRLHIGQRLDLIRQGEWQFMWLTDPPLFEEADGGKWVSSHHPFTSPREEDEEYLLSDPGRVLARAYDLVLNGVELGGGSIRIHRPDLQARVFEALGIGPEEAKMKFGFLLEAFRYGAPPHGGIAFGLDRLAMLMTGAQSLRDVMAFPKTQRGTCLMTEAPTPVDKAQLEELFVESVPPPAAQTKSE